MMKYYKNTNSNVFAFANDGSQDDYIGADLVLITQAEADELLNPPLSLEQQAEAINSSIQAHLDTKAQEFRYDNMMSARSYTGYTNAFQVEAQALATWASECWVVAGQIEADVQSGVRTMPTVDEVLAELPVYM